MFQVLRAVLETGTGTVIETVIGTGTGTETGIGTENGTATATGTGTLGARTTGQTETDQRWVQGATQANALSGDGALYVVCVEESFSVICLSIIFMIHSLFLSCITCCQNKVCCRLGDNLTTGYSSSVLFILVCTDLYDIQNNINRRLTKDVLFVLSSTTEQYKSVSVA